MTNFEYSEIAEVTKRTLDIIDDVFNEIPHLCDTERTIYKDLFIALIRKERLDAAITYHEQKIDNSYT